MKRILCSLLAVALCVCMAGCSKTKDDDTNGVTDVYADKTVGFQLEKPMAGEQVAIMHTSMGDIAIRLFPEAAPKAVTNFVTHAKNGYYNGLTFHRVIKDFMIQGGDPKGDGTGGEAAGGGTFEDEFDVKLLNLRGSLAMANSGVNTNGSQFFINQGDADSFGTRKDYQYSEKQKRGELGIQYRQMVQQYGADLVAQYYGTEDKFIEMNMPTYVYERIPDAVWDLYEKNGGSIHLDGAWRRSGGHTVFGQVYAGMEIVDAIAKVETDSNDKPKTAVVITSIDIVTYPG